MHQTDSNVIAYFKAVKGPCPVFCSALPKSCGSKAAVEFRIEGKQGRDTKHKMAPHLLDLEQPLVSAADLPVPVKQARKWRGHWAQLFGPSCEPHDAAACYLASYAPPIAFGWNAQRALGLSWWKEGLRFFILAFGLLMLSQFVLKQTMMVVCRPVPALQMDPRDDAFMMAGGPMDAVMPAHAAAAASMSIAGLERQFCAVSACQAAIFCAIISTLGSAAAIIIASRRRTAIRERYGIDGTPMGDCCLWTWCAPCALAQETRTLMHNNVDGEVWHGPNVAPAPITALRVCGTPPTSDL